MTAISIPLMEFEDDPRVSPTTRPRAYLLEGANFPIQSRVFPQDGPYARYYQTFLPDYTSTLVVDVYWYALQGNNSGTVTWVAAVAAVTNADATPLDQKAFAASSSTASTVLDNRRMRLTSITIANTDSLAAGDMLVVKLNRLAGDAGGGVVAHLLGASLRFVV